MARRRPLTDARRDPRYSSARWQRVRLACLQRDLWRCWVADCQEPGNVADHVEPVYLGMPDAEFYALNNLRASCRRHNIARGFAAILERDTGQGVKPLARPRWATVKWSS